MAFSKTMAFVAVLVVLLPMSAFAWDGDISPSIANEICKEVECGKGTCNFDTDQPLGFSCECDQGWKRTRDDDDDDEDHKFLPCVIPNCTLDYDCQPAPVVPETEVLDNISAFDPCDWVDCGEGDCVKNATYEYKPVCICNSDSSNLLDISAFPCYKECTLKPDCASLGIKVANSTSGTGNDSNGGNVSNAISFLPGKFQLMTIVMVSVGMILWK